MKVDGFERQFAVGGFAIQRVNQRRGGVGCITEAVELKAVAPISDAYTQAVLNMPQMLIKLAAKPGQSLGIVGLEYELSG